MKIFSIGSLVCNGTNMEKAVGTFQVSWHNGKTLTYEQVSHVTEWTEHGCSPFKTNGGIQMTGKRNVAFRRAAWHSSAADFDHTAHFVTDSIQSRWISKTNGREWIYIDLGTDSQLASTTVHWGENHATAYSIELSPDAKNWTIAAHSVGCANGSVTTELSNKSTRYIRFLLNESSGENYIIREIEVMGTNQLEYKLDPLPAPDADGRQNLTGGNWRVQRASEVAAEGPILSQPEYDDAAWLPASVPDTILVSYLKAGAIPDPNYDDWQNQVSDSFFTADFWYRNSFPIPFDRKGSHVFLNFDALNWKADVFFNGRFLPNPVKGREKSIEGAFMRGKFDVTELVNFGTENHLAVLIYKNDTPEFGHLVEGPDGLRFDNKTDSGEKLMVSSQGLAEGPWNNGGRLGMDNPTFHAAIGWDWLPTIRGRDIGLYNEVFLTYSDGVEMEDPWMETRLNLTQTSADLVAANLAKDRPVTSNSPSAGISVIVDDNPDTDWLMSGSPDESFTVDLGEATPVGSVIINWGEVPDTAAYETQNAKRFKLESSLDGLKWNNFDAYPGGEIDGRWFGMLHAEPSSGTDAFEGHNVSNVISGPTGRIELDLRAHGYGMFPIAVPAPEPVRFLRFTTVERMHSMNSRHGEVPPKIRDIRVFAESAESVGQSMVRAYALDASKAVLTFRTEVKNSQNTDVTAFVSGIITPGNIPFSTSVDLKSGEKKTVEITGIILENPELWWPNTYGAQFLYEADVKVAVEGKTSDGKRFKFGVREFAYPIDGDRLTLYCNGTRIIAKGGNWGMDDGLKLDRAEVYDNKVRLTAEENMVMIRNWVGQTNNEAFYEACDKYGILIWDDFWLANPADGPNPKDEEMFLQNAIDKVCRYRYHAALAMYCGRNESNPPESLDVPLKALTEKYDGTRTYFPNSAGAPVGSGGGYALRHPRQYFDDVPNVTLRSETGIPNVPDYESIQRFLPVETQWPISESWALHDFTFYMNGPANSYVEALKSYKDLAVDVIKNPGHKWNSSPALTASENPEFLAYKHSVHQMVKQLGEELTLREFARIAQLINYEHHRALFEGSAVKRSNGALMWMSQSSFPSFMWQTYDYFLATNAGYFGTKAGNQPTHAVVDPRTDEIVLSNATARTYVNVTTDFLLYDLHGRTVSVTRFPTDLLGPDAYGIVLGKADFSEPQTDVVFMKLTVRDASGHVLGDNLYWHNRKDYLDYRAFQTLAPVDLSVAVSTGKRLPNGNDLYSITLANTTVEPALQARLRTSARATGRDVLPTFYSDNYITLMPGDTRVISVEFSAKHLEGGEPDFHLDGWNVQEKIIPTAS